MSRSYGSGSRVERACARSALAEKQRFLVKRWPKPVNGVAVRGTARSPGGARRRLSQKARQSPAQLLHASSRARSSFAGKDLGRRGVDFLVLGVDLFIARHISGDRVDRPTRADHRGDALVDACEMPRAHAC